MKLEDEPDLRRLRDYENWKSLLPADKLKLCKERSPDVLKGKYNHLEVNYIYTFDCYLIENDCKYVHHLFNRTV